LERRVDAFRSTLGGSLRWTVVAGGGAWTLLRDLGSTNLL
jgi:hypothetical protein